MKTTVSVLSLVALAACSPKFEGTYANPSGQAYFTFAADGTCTSNFFDVLKSTGLGTPECTYRKDGNSVKVHVVEKNKPATDMTWTINDSGSLNAGMWGVLVKR